MKKIIALALSALLLVGAAVVGTVAFLTDTDQAINVMTSGNIEIDQLEKQRKDFSTGELESFVNSDMFPAFTMDPVDKWPTESVSLEGLTGTYSMWNPGTVKNVKDKIVYVENTGKNDAYVRTILAFENPTLANGDEVIEYVKMNVNGTLTDLNMTVSINGTPYALFAYTYAEAIPAKSNAAPSLLQIAFAEGATNEHMAAIKGTYDILSLTQASQTEGFDAVTAGEALDRVFGGLTEENIIKWFTGTAPTPVTDNEKLEEALTANKENIIVILENDVTYDVAAWAMDAMGGDPTKSITIYGNGHTITFNHTNSDWNNIALKNDAVLTINDAHITNSGHNNGPWNRHDLNFDCPVVLNNVTTDKALAFKSDATLNNVTIKDANTSDTYAIWIQPNGQTVSIDGLVVDMLDCTDGRGIKIDEQYVTAPEKVTLTVKNATFKTEEKAAILVKSVAGADIVLDNVDISGVKVDPIHAVWVDEASADYADLVTVTGGKKLVENAYVTNADELKAAVASGLTDLYLADGEYNVYGCGGKTLTLTGSKNAVIKLYNDGEDGCDYAFGDNGTGVGNVTFNGLTIDTTSNTGNYKGFAYMKGTFNDCNFVGAYSLNNANDFVFNRCTFDFKNGYFWTWGANSVTFNGCTFNGNSKAILAHGYVSTVINVNDCAFAATEKGYASGGTVWTSAVEIDPAGTNVYTINITDSTINDNYSGWTRVKDGSTGHSIVVNGVTMTP